MHAKTKLNSLLHRRALSFLSTLHSQTVDSNKIKKLPIKQNH